MVEHASLPPVDRFTPLTRARARRWRLSVLVAARRGSGAHGRRQCSRSAVGTNVFGTDHRTPGMPPKIGVPAPPKGGLTPGPRSRRVARRGVRSGARRRAGQASSPRRRPTSRSGRCRWSRPRPRGWRGRRARRRYVSRSGRARPRRTGGLTLGDRLVGGEPLLVRAEGGGEVAQQAERDALALGHRDEERSGRRLGEARGEPGEAAPVGRAIRRCSPASASSAARGARPPSRSSRKRCPRITRSTSASSARVCASSSSLIVPCTACLPPLATKVTVCRPPSERRPADSRAGVR